MRYYFDWDPHKTKTNKKKHGISFEEAATIFHDPRMISVFDRNHSEHEERWATIGLDRNGILLVVVHTFKQIDADCCKIRIISARWQAEKKQGSIRREINEKRI